MVAEPRPATGEAPEIFSAGPSRSRLVAVLLPIGIILLLWLWIFLRGGAVSAPPSGKGLGADFAMFVAAGQVMRTGGNPYDSQLLYRTEHGMLRRQGLPIIGQRSIVRVGNPPLLYWALEPVGRWPFRTAASIWILLQYALTLLGCLGVLAYLGWTRKALASMLFLATPAAVFAAYWGNVDGLLFGAVGVSLALCRRWPALAGVWAAAAWLKPQVALPLALLVALFHASDRRRYLLAFAAATLSLTVITIAATGPHDLTLWLRSSLTYSRDIGIQREMPSLSGLYVRWAIPGLRTALQVLSLAAACILTLAAWWRSRAWDRVPSLAIAWLWVVWFLAVPYTHFQDEVLLALPVFALLGRNGRRLGRPLAVAGLYSVILSPLLIVWSPFRIDLISLPLLALAACVALEGRTAEPAGSRDTQLPAAAGIS